MELHPFLPFRFSTRVLEERTEPGERVSGTVHRLDDVENVCLNAGFSRARNGAGDCFSGTVLRICTGEGGVHVPQDVHRRTVFASLSLKEASRVLLLSCGF